MEPALARLGDHLRRADPGGVLGVSLFGSSARGGLRPDSDIDVLVLTRRSLSARERAGLLDLLLQFSGRRATRLAGRPLEVTSLVVDDVVPWRYPPVCDFLYGEWLRDELGNGEVPQRHTNPDLAVLVTTVREHAVCLQGLPPADLLAPVPMADLRRSLRDGLDPLLGDLVGDERNVLLTLARMVVTLETGRIVPKDVAVQLLLPTLGEPHRSLLSSAARAYRGESSDEGHLERHAARTAGHLALRVRTV